MTPYRLTMTGKRTERDKDQARQEDQTEEGWLLLLLLLLIDPGPALNPKLKATRPGFQPAR